MESKAHSDAEQEHCLELLLSWACMLRDGLGGRSLLTVRRMGPRYCRGPGLGLRIP